MQSNGNESSPDGVRDGQASQAHAIQAQDAVRPTYQPRQRSPLSTQHRQAAYSELTGSSDDESGGIDYDTDDSALQDYMDNIAEQEQGNPCDFSSEYIHLRSVRCVLDNATVIELYALRACLDCFITSCCIIISPPASKLHTIS